MHPLITTELARLRADDLRAEARAARRGSVLTVAHRRGRHRHPSARLRTALRRP